MAIQTKGKKEKALKKPPSTWFVVNNDGLPSIILNEVDRLADVEVDTSSLSNMKHTVILLLLRYKVKITVLVKAIWNQESLI